MCRIDSQSIHIAFVQDMVVDEGARFKKALLEHNARPTHTKRVLELLWLADDTEHVPVAEMSVSYDLSGASERATCHPCSRVAGP